LNFKLKNNRLKNKDKLFLIKFIAMKLVFATNNLNKLKEVQSLIPEHIELLSLKDIGCFEDVPETQLTIKGNAIQKAEYIKKHYGFDCFADDTGLEVEMLNGEPGVFSARYAGAQRDANDNMDLLLNNLKNKPNRNAQFKTVVALHLNSKLETFTGICKGDITANKHGDQGFGYDPIFKAKGYHKTFAEISLQEKNTIGHRGKAVRLLVDFLNNL
jgi:XTP/dITP diphosphohydrolase